MAHHGDVTMEEYDYQASHPGIHTPFRGNEDFDAVLRLSTEDFDRFALDAMRDSIDKLIVQGLVPAPAAAPMEGVDAELMRSGEVRALFEGPVDNLRMSTEQFPASPVARPPEIMSASQVFTEVQPLNPTTTPPSDAFAYADHPFDHSISSYYENLPLSRVVLNILNAVSLAEHYLPKTSTSSLSKPVACPGGTPGLFVFGTEETDPKKHRSNKLYFARLGRDFTLSIDDIVGHSIEGPVQDILWLDSNNAVFAVGRHANIMRVTHDQDGISTNMHYWTLPSMHRQPIREMAYNDGILATAGDDGQLSFTDMAYARVADQNIAQSICLDTPLSGVSFYGPHPMCTSDNGGFFLFDRRDTGEPSVQYISGKMGLFGHAVISSHVVMLGFDGGEIQFLDLRKNEVLAETTDSAQASIGELRGGRGGSAVVCFGAPTVTAWGVGGDELAWRGSQPLAAPEIQPPNYRTSGTFFDGDKIAVTDSLGMFCVMQVNV